MSCMYSIDCVPLNFQCLVSAEPLVFLTSLWWLPTSGLAVCRVLGRIWIRTQDYRFAVRCAPIEPPLLLAPYSPKSFFLTSCPNNFRPTNLQPTLFSYNLSIYNRLSCDVLPPIFLISRIPQAFNYDLLSEIFGPTT
jgi:hypothetical protein